MLEHIPFKRPLVIGTGGGNDIVSATLVLADFAQRGLYCDLAGLCSPGALHFYDGQTERSVNKVTANAKRFLESKGRKQLSFIDSLVPEVLRKNGFDADVYNLSGRFGTDRLVEGLEDLAQERGYDGIIAVDVGGDILGRGKLDPTLLSPLMDFTTLYALKQLNLPSVLVEFGLQTDGELRPKGCAEILDELKTGKMLLAENSIKRGDAIVRRLEEVYDSIKEVRHGHTLVMTMQTLEAEQDINTEYRFHVHVLDKKATHRFPLTLERKYFGKVFTIDLKALADTRPNAFPYANNLEMYLKTKLVADTKTEMDTLYYSNGDSIVWLGMLGPQISGAERNELLSYGLGNLLVHADSAVLWRGDAEKLKLRKHSAKIGEFVVTADEKDKFDNLTKEVLGVFG